MVKDIVDSRLTTFFIDSHLQILFKANELHARGNSKHSVPVTLISGKRRSSTLLQKSQIIQRKSRRYTYHLTLDYLWRLLVLSL
jgi:hypothetical protein